MKTFTTNSISLSLLLILTSFIFFTSCGKESINELETIVETVEASNGDVVNKKIATNANAINKGIPCNGAIQGQIVTALDGLILDLRSYKCGYNSSSTAVQNSFEDYKSDLEGILSFANISIPNYVNANPNGGGCVNVPASGTLGSIYALDYLGCTIGTFLNSSTAANWEQVIQAFESYLSVLEDVFTCDWNLAAYRSVLEAGC